MSASSRRILAGIAALALVGGAGAVWAKEGLASNDNDSGSVAYAPIGSDNPHVDSPDEAIKKAMAGLDADLFENVSITKAPADSAGDQWFNATMKSSQADGSDLLHLTWEADLAQGAVAELLSEDKSSLAHTIAGSTLLAQVPGHKELADLSGGAGAVAGGQVFGAQKRGDSDEEIEQSVTKTMQALGFSIDTVNVLRPLGPAVAITAILKDPKADQPSVNEILEGLQGTEPNYEGIYLQLQLPDGETVLRQSTDYRTGTGRLSFAPGYDEVFGAVHGGRLVATAAASPEASK